jgi:hypothetical protein
MITDETPRMAWKRKQCDIINGQIVELTGLPEEEYNPFDYYFRDGTKSLHNQFIEIDETSAEEIKKFVNAYGFLGLNESWVSWWNGHREGLAKYLELNPVINEVSSENMATFINDLLGAADRFTFDNTAADFIYTALPKNVPLPRGEEEQIRDHEDVDDFVKEILKMRAIVNLRNYIKENDTDAIIEEIKRFYELEKWDMKFFRLVYLNEKSNAAEIKVKAKMFIASQINTYVSSETYPVLDWRGDDSSFKSSWKTTSLLSAMYTMLFMDLAGGKIIRKCRNETCNKYFPIYGNDERKIYCDATCKRSQVQREYRRRKKGDARS